MPPPPLLGFGGAELMGDWAAMDCRQEETEELEATIIFPIKIKVV